MELVRHWTLFAYTLLKESVDYVYFTYLYPQIKLLPETSVAQQLCYHDNQAYAMYIPVSDNFKNRHMAKHVYIYPKGDKPPYELLPRPLAGTHIPFTPRHFNADKVVIYDSFSDEEQTYQNDESFEL